MTDVVRKDVLNRLESGDYSCSKELTLSMFSGKWKLVILYHLGVEGPYRFNEFRRLLPQITHKVLTNQLREMEEDGLINRKVEAETQIKVTYSITEVGKSLMPIVLAMYDWGENRIKDLQKENIKPIFTLEDE